MRSIGTNHKVSRIPEDSVNYVALALRFRLQSLIESMIAAAGHRARAQFDREPGMYEVGGTEENGEQEKTPMWDVLVRRDTRKILEVLERVEREEEMRVRRERRERTDAAAAAAIQASQAASSPTLDGPGTSAGSAAGGGDDTSSVAGGTVEGATTGGPPAKKPKKKKDGPGVTARNLSEDVQKRLSNAVATQAAGLGRGKYAWMNAGGAAAAAAAAAAASPKPKPATASKSTAKDNSTSAETAAATNGANGTDAGTTANGTTSTQSTVGANASATQTTAATSSAVGSTWAKPYVPAAVRGNTAPAPGDEDKTFITLRDAMFVIERERGHGAGRGSARAWV